MQSLADKRVLITGGSSGIGLACAQRLGRAGARTVLVARGQEGLNDALSQVPNCVGVFAADAGVPEQIGEAVRFAAERLDGIDVVVAAAAALSYGPFMELSMEDYTRTISSTLLSGVNTTYAVLPELARSHGTLVIVASVAGRVPVPWLAAYSAAKHGLRGFTRALACELRALDVPVRLALVNPGPVDTPIWPRARTPDGRLPPLLDGPYRAADVAAEIELAIRGRGPMERSVGGLMALWERFDALLPNLSVRVTGTLAGLGWRNRDQHPRQESDGLTQPTTRARVSAGLRSRPSLLTKLRTITR